ncbi:hypothetical protein [Edaphobacter paludis]|uniref:hypothetical protein n=1 Tax=Edaphobacter paludis TaxID=3035702 RepID=UPI0035A033E9
MDNPPATDHLERAIHIPVGVLFKDRDNISWDDSSRRCVRVYAAAVAVEAVRSVWIRCSSLQSDVGRMITVLPLVFMNPLICLGMLYSAMFYLYSLPERPFCDGGHSMISGRLIR